MRLRSLGNKRASTEHTRLSAADEAVLVESYETGLAVTCAHQPIWQTQLQYRHLDIETLCKQRSAEHQRDAVKGALVTMVTLTASVPLRLE